MELYELVYPIGIHIFPIGYSLFPIGYSLLAISQFSIRPCMLRQEDAIAIQPKKGSIARAI